MKPNYASLEQTLTSGPDVQTFTFTQIEEIIQTPIPSVYLRFRTLKQASSRFRSHARRAGFALTEVDYVGQTMTFVRGGDPIAPRRHGNPGHHHHRAVRAEVSPRALDPNDVGKELDSSIAYFKAHWASTGGEYVPFLDRYDDPNVIYFQAGMEAYRAAMRRAIKLQEVTQRTRDQLREQSCRYLATRLATLFALPQESLNVGSYNDWAEETTMGVRAIYRNAGVNDYTVGNAQKLVNVAMKFVMSSNRFRGDNLVFFYCHFPVDARIQNTIKSQLGVHLLHQNGQPRYGNSSWSKNDNWADFLDYQARVREAVLRFGYYSPMVWEATHWE